MRHLVAIAILALGVAGATGATAADLHVGRLGRALHYSAVGRRAYPHIVYGFEPGISVRAYWLRPWCNRHYFPFGHDRWDRHKTLSYVRPKPAQSFHQYWSTSRAFISELPRVDVRDQATPDQHRPIFEK